MIVLAPPLDAISRVARPYPAWLLENCETGLCLFAAAFLGHNDAIHFARAGIQTTCVDVDGDRLEEMFDLYPANWDFVQDDAWDYAHAWQGKRQWDVVSVDTFTGTAMEQSLASLEVWCSLARKAVTATIVNGTGYTVPAGWKADLFPRSTEVSWLVLERA